MRYSERLNARITSAGTHLCVGLDPRPEMIDCDIAEFLDRVVGETAEHAAAFKPNMAYFEALGLRGVQILENLLEKMPKEVPVILDCKRSDIGETQRYYARAYFEHWNVDAVTLNPFLGFDTIEPFLQYEGKGAYLLAVTSNVGSADIQMQQTADGRYLFELVQDFAAKAEGMAGDVGLVVGLTNASGEVRSRIADLPLLMPGLGAQGGDLQALAKDQRKAPVVVNVSRGVMYAEGSFADAAKKFKEQINVVLG
ncbi:MAG: orotidine-5'-phosphate decarboxylase [Verrucomicrobiales bacterium]